MAEETKNKNTEIIKDITGNRLEKYTTINEIETILEKNMATNIADALKIDDVYLTLSQLNDLTRNDLDRKIYEAISNQP